MSIRLLRTRIYYISMYIYIYMIIANTNGNFETKTVMYKITADGRDRLDLSRFLKRVRIIARPYTIVHL